MKMNTLLSTLIVLCLTGTTAIKLQAANVDVVKIHATILVQTNDTTTDAGTRFHVAKMRITTKDVLKVAADALGYADTTFGTGEPVSLGISSGLVNPVDSGFLILDSTGTNIVLNLDAALGDNGGYFHIDTHDGVMSGFDGGMPQHYIHTTFGSVQFYDGTGLSDGGIHSFQIAGLEICREKISDHQTYRESFSVTGAGDVWDGEFNNLIGVVISGTVSGTGKGPIEE